jgi:starch synthase
MAPNLFNKETFKLYEALLADKMSKKTEVMQDIRKYLFYAQIQQNKNSLHYLEKLLIQLLGHYDFDIRDQSIICLNMLYDGVDWQFGVPFEPKVTCVKSQFVIEETVISSNPLNYVLLFLSAPAFCLECKTSILTWHPLQVTAVNSKKGEYSVKFKLKEFWRCGFFDWKLLEIDNEGKVIMLRKLDADGNETFAQGRFIVHPEGVNEQQIHEVVVDYKDQDADPNKDFYTLAQEIPKYAEMGVNCLYLMGALERDNGLRVDEKTGELWEVRRPEASPLAIIDRSEVNRMLGGAKGYQKLMNEAEKAKIKILVDCMSRVSSTRPHRKYRKNLLQTMDAEGKRTLCYGTDGRSVNYEDTAILNYRKLSSWNMLVQDTIKIAEKYKINGVHLDNAQTWPVILELDEEELYRKDSDGHQAYSNKEILDGVTVRQCEGQGYWDSDSLIKYPNPIFIKLCRELWARFPDFLILGECLGGSLLENRQGILARSGVIPRLFKLPVALASIFGKKLMKDGQVMGCKPETVRVIKTWYESNRRFTPEGSYLVQSSSSHIWPYPALLYARGAWSAVDVLFFMPDIPMTFMNEIYGSAYRKNITSVYQAKPLPKQYMKRPKSQLHMAMEGQEEEQTRAEEFTEDKRKKIPRVSSLTSLSVVASPAEAKKKDEEITQQLGPQFGFDLKKIHLHYEHRRRLRKEKPVLRYGDLVILEAKHSEGTHPHVFAFARFSPSETAVIAINFTDRNVSFYIDMNNLLPLMQKHYPPNIVVLFSDWILDGKKDYYFLHELINSKVFMTLKPFASLCRGIMICKNDPYAFAVALEESAIRLNTKIIKNTDCSSSQLCLLLLDIVSKYGSLNDFYMCVTAINKLYAIPNNLTLNSIYMNAFQSQENSLKGGVFLEYCKRILKFKESLPSSTNYSAIPALEGILNSSKLGPIVFVTPEVGRWSTVGGLGVMVDELSQGKFRCNKQ